MASAEPERQEGGEFPVVLACLYERKPPSPVLLDHLLLFAVENEGNNQADEKCDDVADYCTNKAFGGAVWVYVAGE